MAYSEFCSKVESLQDFQELSMLSFFSFAHFALKLIVVTDLVVDH
jgi:hypothetical protein